MLSAICLEILEFTSYCVWSVLPAGRSQAQAWICWVCNVAVISLLSELVSFVSSCRQNPVLQSVLHHSWPEQSGRFYTVGSVSACVQLSAVYSSHMLCYSKEQLNKKKGETECRLQSGGNLPPLENNSFFFQLKKVAWVSVWILVLLCWERIEGRLVVSSFGAVNLHRALILLLLSKHWKEDLQSPIMPWPVKITALYLHHSRRTGSWVRMRMSRRGKVLKHPRD